MARPTTLRGTKLLIKLGNGASPETFTAPCALVTKSLSRSAGLNEFNLEDCDNPDAPIWTERVKGALTGSVSGSGTLAKESLDAYEDFFAAVESRNVQVTLDFSGDPRTYQGAFHLATLNITGEQDGLVQVEIELQSDGVIEIV